MLPDYPKLKRYIIKQFNLTVQKEIGNDAFLSIIRHLEVHEGNSYKVTSIEGYNQEDVYKKLEAKFNLTSEEVTKRGPEVYIEKAKEVAVQLREQEAKNLFDKMSEVTEKTGNIVDAKSKLSPETILDALEKVEIDFDDFGNPLFPSLIVSPDVYDRIKDEIPKWEKDPKVIARQKAIVEKKKAEWIDRENNRKLVD